MMEVKERHIMQGLGRVTPTNSSIHPTAALLLGFEH